MVEPTLPERVVRPGIRTPGGIELLGLVLGVLAWISPGLSEQTWWVRLNIPILTMLATWLAAMAINFFRAIKRQASQYDALYVQAQNIGHEVQTQKNQLENEQYRFARLDEERMKLGEALQEEQTRNELLGAAFATCARLLPRITIVGASIGRFDPEPQLILEKSLGLDRTSFVIVVEASTLRELGLFQVVAETLPSAEPPGLLAKREWADALWWGDINQQAIGRRPLETTAVALLPPPGSLALSSIGESGER